MFYFHFSFFFPDRERKLKWTVLRQTKTVLERPLMTIWTRMKTVRHGTRSLFVATGHSVHPRILRDLWELTFPSVLLGDFCRRKGKTKARPKPRPSAKKHVAEGETSEKASTKGKGKAKRSREQISNKIIIPTSALTSAAIHEPTTPLSAASPLST